MTPWTETEHCKSRAHCRPCRDPGDRGKRFRADKARFWTPPPQWECPFGVTAEPLLEKPGAFTEDDWRETVAAIATSAMEEWTEHLNTIANFVAHGGCTACKIRRLQNDLIRKWRARETA